MGSTYLDSRKIVLGEGHHVHQGDKCCWIVLAFPLANPATPAFTVKHGPNLSLPLFYR